MIAAAGYVAWRRGERADLALNAEPHLRPAASPKKPSAKRACVLTGSVCLG